MAMLTQSATDRRWEFHFQYNEVSFVLSIDHSGDTEQRAYPDWRCDAWIDGKQFIFETMQSKAVRYETAAAYGDRADDDGYWHCRPIEDHILSRIQDCLDRWKAIKFIVEPVTSI